MVTAQVLPPLLQLLEYGACGGQILLAFRAQAQAARGACKQAHLQLALQPLDGRRYLPRQQVGFDRRRGETAQAALRINSARSSMRIIFTPAVKVLLHCVYFSLKWER